MRKTYTLQVATARCGYRRVNTTREKHLADEAGRDRLGYHLVDGKVHLDAEAVDRLAKDLAKERHQRGNWRVKNLGDWAKVRDARRGGRRGRKTDG